MGYAVGVGDNTLKNLNKLSSLLIVIDKMDAELTCGICLELFDNALMLPCSHNFCKKCLEGIIDNRSQFRRRHTNAQVTIDCPFCQKHIVLENGIDSVPVNRTLENIVEFHRSKSMLPCSDASWNTDSIKVTENICRKHEFPMSFYCKLCNISVCKGCSCYKRDKNAVHQCVQIKELSNMLQAKISSSLTEIKMKSILLNDRIQLLEDMIAEIDGNEKKVEKVLESEFNALVSRLKSRQEELSRILSNDFNRLKFPVTEQLRQFKTLQETIQEHIKRLSMVKATKDISLRVKLMQDSEKQLNSLLCFDLAWFASNDTPVVDMPSWSIAKEDFEDSVDKINWKPSGTIATNLSKPIGTSQSRNVSNNPSISFKPSIFNNFVGSSENKDDSDNEMVKQPKVPGIMVLKNDASSNNNLLSKNGRMVDGLSVSVPSSVQNMTNTTKRQNITQPTTNIFSNAETDASSIQSLTSGNITFPVLTSADFLPAQDVDAHNNSGKSQGRNVSVLPSKSSLISPDSNNKIKMTMENEVSSFSESGFTGNIVQRSSFGGQKSFGLAKQGTDSQTVSSLSNAMECLPFTGQLSAVNSTSTSSSANTSDISKFSFRDSVGSSNIGTSSNFLFSTATPFPMTHVPMLPQSVDLHTPHNIDFKEPSFTNNTGDAAAITVACDASMVKPPLGTAVKHSNLAPNINTIPKSSSNVLSESPTVTSGYTAVKEPPFTNSAGDAAAITVACDANMVKPPLGTAVKSSNLTPNINTIPKSSSNVLSSESPTVTLGLNSRNSLNQADWVMPTFIPASSQAGRVNTTSTILSISSVDGNTPVVNPSLSGSSVVCSLSSKFPCLSARDFSPNRAGISSQKSATRRTLKPKKIIKTRKD